jgi:hypothetical protein
MKMVELLARPLAAHAVSSSVLLPLAPAPAAVALSV